MTYYLNGDKINIKRQTLFLVNLKHVIYIYIYIYIYVYYLAALTLYRWDKLLIILFEYTTAVGKKHRRKLMAVFTNECIYCFFFVVDVIIRWGVRSPTWKISFQFLATPSALPWNMVSKTVFWVNYCNSLIFYQKV